MERKYGDLGGNKTTRVPRYYLFVDTESFVHRREDETQYTDHIFRMGTAIFVDRLRPNMERRYVFHTLERFYDILDKHTTYINNKLYVFAHNQSYDFVQLQALKYMAERGFKLDRVPLIEPRFISASFVREGSSSVEFRDTYNILNRPLSEIGLALGKPKLEHDDWNKITDSDLEKYCMRDTEIIRDFVMMYVQFIIDNGLGNLKATISGQAFESYKVKFRIQGERHIISRQETVLAMERDSYHGARVQAFKFGEITVPDDDLIYQLDYNSMYAYVMDTERYPTEYIGMVSGSMDSDKQFFKDTARGLLSIARVTIQTDKGIFPVTVGDHLEYPTGEFVTTLTQPELEYAVEHKMVKQWHRRNVYVGAYIFHYYVQFFYEMKRVNVIIRDNPQNSDEERAKASVLVMIAKAFLVGLYGKFGQKRRKIEEIGKTEDTGSILELDANTGNITTTMQVGGIAYNITELTEETVQSMPSIASFVTAYGRMKNLKVLESVPICYYTDTDSFYVNQEGYDILKNKGMVDPYELGKLKIEDTFRSFTIHSLKHLEKNGKRTVVDEIILHKVSMENGHIIARKVNHKEGKI